MTSAWVMAAANRRAAEAPRTKLDFYLENDPREKALRDAVERARLLSR